MNSFWPVQEAGSSTIMEAKPRVSSWENYQSIREQILESDRRKRFSDGIEWTEEEEAAAAKMDRRRSFYINFFMKNKTDSKIPFLNPSRSFCELKKEIEKTDLYQVFKAMPKGGNLHLHTSSSCTAEWIFKTLIENNKAIRNHPEAKTLPPAYIYLSYDKIGERDMTFGELAFFEGKPPKGYQLLNSLQYSDLLKFTAGRVTVDQVPYIWDEFSRIFARVSNLFVNAEFYEMYYKESFKMLVDDEIFYLELRTGFTAFCGTSDALFKNEETAGLDSAMLEGYLAQQSVRNEETEFIDRLFHAAEEAGKYARDKGKPGFRLKLILSTSRKCFYRTPDKTEDKIESNVVKAIQRAIELKNNDSKSSGGSGRIVGFDFVSEEDRGGRTIDCARIIMKHELYDIDYFFHDGESNWATDDNVLDAYLLSSRRIGHGFNLFRFPALLEMYKGNVERGKEPTVLEICPISNQMLRYTNDLRNHPACELMTRGVQCVIASDDPQIFENHGLTHDFFAAYYWMQLSLQDIKALVFNSIKYSAASDSEKDTMLRELKPLWYDFIAKTNKELVC